MSLTIALPPASMSACTDDYTHYYAHLRSFSPAEWQAISAAAAALLGHVPPGIALADGRGTPGSVPQVSAESICFNGAAPRDADTFYLWRGSEDTSIPIPAPYACTSCITARRPYDLVVCGVLIAVGQLAPGTLAIRSDGTSSDWRPALDWVRSVLGSQYQLPPGIGGIGDV